MTNELKQIECDDKCGFMVRSHDESELLNIAKTHVKTMHNMNVTDDDMKKKMTTSTAQFTTSASR